MEDRQPGLPRPSGSARGRRFRPQERRVIVRDAGDRADRPSGAFCFDVVHGSATRSIDLLGEKAPKGLVDVLSEVIAAEPANWSRRVNAIHFVAVLDPSRARVLADELLQVPATLVPLGARLDALAELGETSRQLRDFARALKAYDLYLDTLRHRPVPVPSDVWNRLTSLPEKEEGPRADNERLGWFNITWALGRKVQTCIDAEEFPHARLAFENLLAATFALIDSMAKESDKAHISALVDTEDMDVTEP